MGKKKTDAAQYDAAWKEALQLYFREFLAFFFPAVETDINWDRGLEFLDKEFHQIVQGLLKEKYQSRSVDKLVRVHRKNGKEELVLVHVEIQSQKTGDFCERMYLYNSLIYRRYGQKVASFAVLADSDASWRPDHFGYQLWGSEVRLSFPMVKLIDYRDRTRELERLRETSTSESWTPRIASAGAMSI